MSSLVRHNTLGGEDKLLLAFFVYVITALVLLYQQVDPSPGRVTAVTDNSTKSHAQRGFYMAKNRD